jgi:hypothetical protein
VVLRFYPWHFWGKIIYISCFTTRAPVANSELLTDKPVAEPVSSISARDQIELNQAPAAGNVYQAADALARDWLQTQAGSDLSTATKAKVLLGAAAEGTVQNGLDQICNHTGLATAEVLGAVALGVALRGPAWTRIPAMAFAAVGTLSYGQQVAEAGINTTSILSHMNSHDLEESRQGLKEALGPVIFNSALMYAAGLASAHVAAKLPTEFPQVKVAQTLSLAKDHLSNLLGVDGDGFPPGMSPAFASGYSGVSASTGRFRLESIMPAAKSPAGENIMQMSSLGGSSTVYGDGIKFKTSRGLSGETFYNVDHVPSGRTVNIQHEGDLFTTIASDGKVAVGFGGGEGRKLDLGQPIRRIVMTEHQTGLKQFRFNDKLSSDLEVDHDGHTVRALLGNGDHLHMLDNIPDGYMHFPHKDGLQTWVEHSGRVSIQMPGTGKMHQVLIPEKLAYIRLLEKADGSKEFRFLNDSGKPVAQNIQLAPTPVLQEVKAPDEVEKWHDLRNYIAAKNHARENLRNNVYDDAINGGGGGMGRGNQSPDGKLSLGHHGNTFGPAPFRLQRSYERIMARELVGVPTNIMRGNDLSAPADMELAMQGHSALVTAYLDRLDFQEEVHHNDWHF